ncbi:MAG: hypothetical protein HMLIMOIP_002098 [Candidatus Nitrosomirales archaeon]|jgi:hypothetical protein
MSLQKELTVIGSGVVGNNQGIGVFVASIIDPGKGRWRIWGNCRHTQPDAVRLRIGATVIIARIPSPALDMTSFGPITVDIVNTTDDIILDLATATGAAETSSGIIYAERVSPL